VNRRVLTPVGPGVWVTTAALDTTTSTVLVDDAGLALVVDPAVTPSEVDALAREVRDRGWRVGAGFATHAHWDHLLWSVALGAVPRWTRPAALATASASRDEIATEAATAGGWTCPSRPDLLARLGGVTEVVPGFPGVRVIGHEAHAPGHAALLVPRARVLIAGDMLSDIEVPLLDAAAAHPVGDYRAGLERLAAPIETGAVDVVVPGHGSVADAAEARRRLALDRSYLEDLAAGRPSADPRLAAGPGWLAAAHAAQARAARAAASSR
jgi:glyoxylase-like metal-dependent hydrolase (beta-lactamase superfamily II)